MNKVILMGRLTRNPEIKRSQAENSTVVSRFTLAVDRRIHKPGENEADFISCISFGKQAEFVEKYFKQGMKMLLSGRIQTGSYTKDGQKVYTTDVVAEEIEFAESKGHNQNVNNVLDHQEPGSENEDGFVSVPQDIDENLPFN